MEWGEVDAVGVHWCLDMFGEMAAPVLSLLAQKGGFGLPGHHCQGGWVGACVWGMMVSLWACGCGGTPGWFGGGVAGEVWDEGRVWVALS